MIPCALCPRAIYPGEEFDTFFQGHAHDDCLADWAKGQEEAAWASGEEES